MNIASSEPVDDRDSQSHRGRSRLRFEIIFASVWLALGLFVLPGAVFFVGSAVLGPYGENGSLGRFYTDFFADLAQPAGRAWGLALGPLLLITLVRLLFVGLHRPHVDAAVQEDEPGRPSSHPRIEPRVGTE